MLQETQSNENNNAKKRFSGHRRSYVDTFRWGFVPEGDSAKEMGAKEMGRAQKPSSSVPAETADPGAPAKSKSRRQHKKTAKMVASKHKETPKAKSVAAPNREANADPAPKKRPARRKSAGVPVKLPYIAQNNFDEDDEDLKLPSYGRTPIPSDDELPVPQKKVSKPQQPPKKTTPKAEPVVAPPPVPEVASGGFRPRREQMVWDPDKSEYVPLVVKAAPVRPQTTPTPPLTTTAPSREGNKKSPLPHKVGGDRPPGGRGGNSRTRQPDVSEEQVGDRPPKERHRRPAPIPPTKENNSPPVEREHVAQQNAVPSKKIHSKPDNPPKPPREPKPSVPKTSTEPPSGESAAHENRPSRLADSRRNRIPKFVESSQPDPADIEAEVSGFAELGVSEIMLEALKIVRYLEPTPIQAGVFQKVQAGVDLMGQAQTGTGKTAAFSMPIIEGVETCPPGNDPVALILVPTRELAVQVRDEAMRLAYGRDIRITACYGGKPLGKQIERLKSGIDILIGTPGRLLDLMNRRALSLEAIRWVVLDEADRMLDIGFRPDIEKILKRTPSNRQTLLFSATLPPPVIRLAEKYMKSPEVLDFSSKGVAVETIDQFYITVDPERKFDALVYLLQEQEPKQAIIFTRTKRGADRLARLLSNRFDSLAAIHGDLEQSQRDSVMAKVRSGALRYLVATDVVGRGIDVSGISHIINYDIPKFCDDYVHRVGRTGRMGREGVAFTFVTAQEGSELTRIEMRIDKLLKRAELKGFESFTKPHDPDVTLEDDPPEPPKPVFGKPIRKVRRAL